MIQYEEDGSERPGLAKIIGSLVVMGTVYFGLNYVFPQTPSERPVVSAGGKDLSNIVEPNLIDSLAK